LCENPHHTSCWAVRTFPNSPSCHSLKNNTNMINTASVLLCSGRKEIKGKWQNMFLFSHLKELLKCIWHEISNFQIKSNQINLFTTLHTYTSISNLGIIISSKVAQKETKRLLRFGLLS
jgi:hypothetical protein